MLRATTMILLAAIAAQEASGLLLEAQTGTEAGRGRGRGRGRGSGGQQMTQQQQDDMNAVLELYELGPNDWGECGVKTGENVVRSHITKKTRCNDRGFRSDWRL